MQAGIRTPARMRGSLDSLLIDQDRICCVPTYAVSILRCGSRGKVALVTVHICARLKFVFLPLLFVLIDQ